MSVLLSVPSPPHHVQVVFYDTNGREVTAFDYSGEEAVREFTSCAFNPSGDTAVFGTYNRFYIYVFNTMRNAWDEVCMGHDVQA